jgi:hypothetical protein
MVFAAWFGNVDLVVFEWADGSVDGYVLQMSLEICYRVE